MAARHPAAAAAAAAADANDEPPASAATAEDRKAASALASLDDAAARSLDAAVLNVDREAVDKAMKSLGRPGIRAIPAPAPARLVRVDPADVVLVADQLELSRPRATELLRAHDGRPVDAMRAFVRA